MCEWEWDLESEVLTRLADLPPLPQLAEAREKRERVAKATVKRRACMMDGCWAVYAEMRLAVTMLLCECDGGANEGES